MKRILFFALILCLISPFWSETSNGNSQGCSLYDGDITFPGYGEGTDPAPWTPTKPGTSGEEQPDDGDDGEPEGDAAAVAASEAAAERLKEQMALISQYNAEIAELEAQLSSLKQQLSYGAASLSQYERQELINKTKALEEQIAAKNEAKSMITGDPVYIATGQYADFCTDVSIRYLVQSFDLTRTYTTDQSVSGSYGKGWVSSLDTRLIFGVENLSGTPPETLSFTREQAASFIASYTAEFGRDSTSWNTICQELRSELAALRSIRSSLSAQHEEAAALVERNRETQSFWASTQLFRKTEALLQEADERIAAHEAQIPVCADTEEAIQSCLDQLARQESLIRQHDDALTRKAAITAANAASLALGACDSWRLAGFETITLIDGTGGATLFSTTAQTGSKGVLQADTGTVWTAVSLSDYAALSKTESGFTLLCNDGRRLFFAQDGLLESISDAFGNTVSLERDCGRKVTHIRTSCGTVYTLTWNGTRLVAVYRGESGETGAEPLVQYAYSNGRLSEVTDSYGDTLRYTWQNGLLGGMQKADGSAVTFTYEACGPDGRLLVTATTNEEGYTERYEYDMARRTTLYTDHAGRQTVYGYDESCRTTYVADSDGVTSFTYDTEGRMIYALYPDGTFERCTYDASGNICSTTYRDGPTYSYARNYAGLITEVRVDGILKLTRTYLSNGLLASETAYGEDTVTTYYAYDARGNMIRAESSEKAEAWTWNSADEVTAYFLNGVCMNTFAREGKTEIITALNGLETRITRDCRKDIVSVVETDIVTGEKRSKTYDYDRRHRITAVSFGDGTVSVVAARYRYDGEGRKEAVIAYHEEGAAVLLYDYEASTLLAFTVSAADVAAHALMTADGFAGADLRALASKTADCSENPYAESSGSSSQASAEMPSYSTSTVSADGRSVTITEGGYYTKTYTLNAWGEPVSITDGNGNTSFLTWNYLGSVSSTIDPYGNETQYAYDPSGELTCITYADGSSKSIPFTLFEEEQPVFDASAFERTSPGISCNAWGSICEAQNEEAHLVYVYDTGNRLTGQKNLNTGYELTYAYDKAGNRVSLSDGERTVLYTYGRNNEILSITELVNGQQVSSVSFSYDVLGRETERTLPNGNTRMTAYDASGNVSFSAEHAYDGRLVWGECFVYDDDGRILATADSSACVTLYGYDESGRLTSVLEAYDAAASDGQSAEAVYLDSGLYYALMSRLNEMQNTLGNRLSVLQSMKRTTYSYDAAGNRLSTQDGVVSAYDAAGNLIRVTAPGRTEEYDWSEDCRMVRSSVSDEKQGIQQIKTYGYDPFGRRVREDTYELTEDGSYRLTERKMTEYDGFSFNIIHEIISN